MIAVICTGSPYPIQVISPTRGKDAYSYTMVWANPKTGGQPIKKYTIKYQKVFSDLGYRTMRNKNHTMFILLDPMVSMPWGVSDANVSCIVL